MISAFFQGVIIPLMPNVVKKILFYLLIAFISWKFFTSFNIGVPKNVKNELNFNRMPQPKAAKKCLGFLKHKNYSDASYCYSTALSEDEGNAEIRYYYAYSMFMEQKYYDSMRESEYIFKNMPKSKYAIYARVLYDNAQIELTNFMEQVQ